MDTKIVYVCLNLILVKTIFAQCIGAPAYIPEAYGIAANGLPVGMPVAGMPIAGMPLAGMPVAGLPTAFNSPLAMQQPMLPPPSFSILSDDLVVDGIVSVAGSLPFLGTVSLGGTVPVTGEGLVNYNCGNGDVGIVKEVPARPVYY